MRCLGSTALVTGSVSHRQDAKRAKIIAKAIALINPSHHCRWLVDEPRFSSICDGTILPAPQKFEGTEQSEVNLDF